MEQQGRHIGGTYIPVKGKAGQNQVKSSMKELINCENSGPIMEEIVKKKDLRDRKSSDVFKWDNAPAKNEEVVNKKKST